MSKVININEYQIDKDIEKDFDDFIPVWEKFWKHKDNLIFKQILISSRLMQAAIIADKEYKFLDKRITRK